jgi:restriction system protein
MGESVSETDLRTRRQLLLKEAVDRAATDPTRLSVRKLISLFGAKARGAQVVKRVSAELASHGLKTEPDFALQHIEATVTLVRKELGAVDEGHEQFDDRVVRVLTIGSSRREVLAVKPTDTIAKARTLMALHDYSQLAVCTTPRSIEGVISWESMGRAELRERIEVVRQALDKALVVDLTDDLLPLLPRIAEAGFVLVRSPDRTLSGIVTASDLTLEFGALAEPFFLLGELESRLRRAVAEAFDPEELAEFLSDANDRAFESVEDLSFGQLIRIIQPPDRWERLGWPIDRPIFLIHVDQVRETRNSLVHFRGDLPSVQDVEQIKRLLELMRRLSPE